MSLLKIDVEKITQLLIEVSVKIILPSHNKLNPSDIEEKDYGELTTIADIKAEAFLSQRLCELLPGSYVIGEEAAYKRKDLFNLLSDDNPVWIIDPIDGTHNFAKGSDNFAVIIALVVSGQTLAGWIYEPVSKKIARGELGSGVYVDNNKVTLVNSINENKHDGIAASYLFDLLRQDRVHVGELNRPNCAGHEYIQLLESNISFTAYTRLRPWDHVAGSFLIVESGGTSALVDNNEYNSTINQGNLLSALNDDIWHKIVSLLENNDKY
jgi:fructose-1,6-bisphosphatase/inositol monophosphatase family enzyme